MVRAWKACVVSALALAFASPRLDAQCAPPDGLDGGTCCNSAQLLVPRPKFTQQALGICWQNCNLAATATYQADWTSLQPGLSSSGAPCGWYTVGVRLSAGGSTRWSGRLQATYARTWIETAITGTSYHVWRFLVNGDLQATTTAGPIPCPVPPCAPAFNNRVRFTGYVDYARDCSSNLFEFAWMLTHACDAVDHEIGFPRGGAFHPDRSYTFVGPAAGFVPAAVLPTEGGGTAFENIRRWRVPPPGATGPVACDFEERLTAVMTPQTTFCMCGAPGTQQHYVAGLTVNGFCGTTIQGIAAVPPFVSMGIGTWTIPGAYPGIETVRWSTGIYQYADPCTGVVQLEYFFGASTIGGLPATQYLSTGPGVALPLTFVDQSNSMLFPAAVTTRNVPFQSDHIFSLNL